MENILTKQEEKQFNDYLGSIATEVLIECVRSIADSSDINPNVKFDDAFASAAGTALSQISYDKTLELVKNIPYESIIKMLSELALAQSLKNIHEMKESSQRMAVFAAMCALRLKR